jgi:AcrR family transcriptional regulator
MQTGAKPRKKPRQERSLVTYDAILEAATRIFGERGYAGATTNEIAELAGVSIGSLYQYFPNKDALIGALQSHHKTEIAAAVKTVLDAAPDRPIRQSIAALAGAWFAIHLRDVRFHRRLETDFLPFDRTDREDIRMTQAIVLDLTALLDRHQHEIVPTDRALAAHIVMRTLMGQVHAALETPLPGVSGATIEHEVIDSILAYLTSRSRSSDEHGSPTPSR